MSALNNIFEEYYSPRYFSSILFNIKEKSDFLELIKTFIKINSITVLFKNSKISEFEKNLILFMNLEDKKFTFNNEFYYFDINKFGFCLINDKDKNFDILYIDILKENNKYASCKIIINIDSYKKGFDIKFFSNELKNLENTRSKYKIVKFLSKL